MSDNHRYWYHPTIQKKDGSTYESSRHHIITDIVKNKGKLEYRTELWFELYGDESLSRDIEITPETLRAWADNLEAVMEKARKEQLIEQLAGLPDETQSDD
jgi:hypothetical protein